MLENSYVDCKVGCVSLMVIWSELRMGQYRDGNHREDAPHFTHYMLLVIKRQIFNKNSLCKTASFAPALSFDFQLITA